MATTDFDYLQTRNEIIEGAFRIVGALPVEQPLSAGLLDQGIKALQLLVKSWSNKQRGIYLWSHNLANFSTAAAQEVYDTALDSTVIGLDKAFVVSGNDDLELEVISWSKYQSIENKETATGRPTHIAFKSTPSPSVYVWPSPDAIYTIKGLWIYPLKDFDVSNGSADTPVKYQRALKYGLAEDLFDEYPGPMNERQYIQDKAAELFREARIGDRPEETTNEIEPLYSSRRY